jgi:methyltransferase (TIGR00027 family)
LRDKEEIMAAPVPSTAVGAAFLRAAHLTEDGNPKIFQDTLAHALVGRALATRLADVLRQSWPPALLPVARVTSVTRARYTEDRLLQRANAGVDQYVILGAGLDTFGYRRPDILGALRVFEVDHPMVQAWKRERLRAAGMKELAGVRFVPVDFERESLQEGLARMGFRMEAPAFVSWLGVTQYLTPAAIQSTLDCLGLLALGSGMVVTYVVPDEWRDDVDRAFAAVAAPVAATRGEPWRTFFHPAEFEALVRTSGFTSVEHFGPDEAATQPYFHNRTDSLRPQGLERYVTARR